MDQNFSFGDWIRKRRTILGLTQEAVAAQVGYSIAMIRKIEDDERRPSPRAAALLAEALEIPEDQQSAFLKVARQERQIDQLGAPVEDESFPWEAASSPQTNLPLPPTLFVGRATELARLTDLLQDPACRLIVLIGMAGTGKTRLALQIAHHQLGRFPDGVFFVSLAPLTSPQMIVTSIGHAIDFQFHEAAEPQEQLLRYLRGKQMLLVLDNFEHLMEGAGLLPTILQAAPGIRILVTSRERLNLQGEWAYEVEGLSFPSETANVEHMESHEAVQLFLQSALRVDPTFRLSTENQEWVARICQLTEGMPLGIELAAAWVRAISPQQIAQEIERSLDFLKASARDLPERHRSLRAALDHSWYLLSAEEKKVFRRLSVFRGGFRREAAQEMAGSSLEEITSLLDKSLLKRVGAERYDLHELVRQYADSRLKSEPQEHDQTHEQHSNYYASQLEGWGKKMASPRQMQALAEMDFEIDNVRVAWGWMVARGQIANIRKSLHSLWRFHEIRGRFQDGAVLMRQAATMLRGLDETETEPDAERSVVLGRALADQGYFCAYLGQYEQAREVLQQSLTLLRASEDRAALAHTLAVLGYMKIRLGEFQDAREHTEESLALYRALGEHERMLYCLVTLSYIHISQGAYQKAYQLADEGWTISRDILGDPLAMEHCLLSLSAASSYLGQYAEAKRWAEQGLQISKALNHRSGIGEALKWLGLISHKMGDTEHAEALLRQSIAEFREIGDRTLVADALVDLGALSGDIHTETDAKQYLLEALQTAIEAQTDHIALQALVEIAAIEMRTGNIDLALQLVTYCRHHSASRQEVSERADSLRAELGAKLTNHQIEAAEAQAHTMTLESLAQEILAAG
jgi:predicted ATPase/transcriptional regulator with XRE-family HTH domain